MLCPKRYDAAPAGVPSALPSIPGRSGDQADYQAGGQVGKMQADLARRLVQEGNVAGVLPDGRAGERSGEQMVRFVSVASGYLVLLAAYAGMVVVLLR